MATQRKTSRRKTPSRPSADDDAPMLDADDFDDAPDDDGSDDLESLIGGGARRASRGGGRGARSLPHDWADFDYGGSDNDWR